MPTKQTVAQFGATVKAKHPEYADLPDDQVGSKVLAKYPEYGDMVDTAPDPTKPPAHPFEAPGVGAKAIIDSMPDTRTGQMIRGAEDNPANQHVPTTGPRSLLQNIGAGATDAIAGLYHEFDGKPGPPDPAAGMTPEQRLQYRADAVANQGEQQTKAFMKDPMGAYASHVGEQLPALIAGAGVHAAAPVLTEGAASGLNAGGRLLRGAGAVVDKVATGAPAAADNLGASAGRGLSRNRIVAASKPSLLRKVQSTVGPAAEARDTILRNSPAAPTDVTPLTQAPFDDISDVKTDPKTGVVNPKGMAKANLMRRAVQEVADPQTGTPTGTPKDLNLDPSEMGRLQTNVYDAADYDSLDSDLANQYLKGTGAKLKGAIDVAAPEARNATQNIHDLLGAQEHLKSTLPKPLDHTDLGPGKVLGRIYDAAKIGGGTAAGAGLDLAGSGLQKAGGALRSLISSDSPVSPSAPPPRRTPLLEANTPTDVPGAGPEDLAGTPASPQRPGVTTPPPVKPLGLPADAGPIVGDRSPSPPLNEGTARTRIAPSPVAPGSGPGPTPAPRRLIAQPDGGIAPEPYPLGDGGPAPLQLESRTGPRAPSQRPSLLRQFRREAGGAAVGNALDSEMATRTSQEKLAQTPVGTTPNAPPVPKAPLVEFPKVPEQTPPTRLPDPTDIDGWERLVDEGYARYNTSTHQYDYTGPIVRRSLLREGAATDPTANWGRLGPEDAETVALKARIKNESDMVKMKAKTKKAGVPLRNLVQNKPN